MVSILLIGMTGEGKSTFVRDYIKSRNVCLFDVQNEYTDLSTDEKSPRYRDCSCDVDHFVEMCSVRQNSVCVFEEATGFFSGKVAIEVNRLMISKRHSRNCYIFVFHSIGDVPPGIIRKMDYVVLYRTSDEPGHVRAKYERLYGSYLSLANKPKFSNEIIKLI